jgi:selT/selW/selH-like putative selenoprotein
MPVSQERFAQGLSYAEYKAQMTRNVEAFAAAEAGVRFDEEDLAFFKQLPQPLNVLALAEDWCGDVIANLPVLGRLAEESGKLDVRVFLRDQNLDLMDQYLHHGKYRSIPVFVFFDRDFNELGYWIERPAGIGKLQQQFRRELFVREPLLAGHAPETSPADLPEEARDFVRAALGRFREENREQSNREVVQEIRALLEHGIAQPGEQATEAFTAVTLQSDLPVSKAEPSANGRVKISITYCAECGYDRQTVELTAALLQALPDQLASLEIIPWHDGAFDVTVNGDLVHSMYRDGGFPEADAMVQAVQSRIKK